MVITSQDVCVCARVCVRDVGTREVEHWCLVCDFAFMGLITVSSVCLLAYIYVCGRMGWGWGGGSEWWVQSAHVWFGDRVCCCGTLSAGCDNLGPRKVMKYRRTSKNVAKKWIDVGVSGIERCKGRIRQIHMDQTRSEEGVEDTEDG